MPDDNLRSYLQELLGASGEPSALEGLSADDPAAGLETLAEDPQELDDALTGLEKLRADEELSAEQQFALEAIILPRERPVVDINGGNYKRPPVPWRHFDKDPFRRHIRTAIQSVGRVEIPNHPSKPYAGTAFVVGDDLLMTNRHVAELFAPGVGLEGLEFIPGRQPGIDFVQEVVPQDEPVVLAFDSLVLVHPYWDCALIKVVGLPAEHPKLTLDGTEPSDLRHTEVVLIGYPARDSRNDLRLQDRIFRSVYDVKRLQPGKIKGYGEVESYWTVEALTHDCSSLGGNSGSGVLDPATGRVLGLHFGGIYKQANYAVPSWQLARDPRLLDAGVNFAGAPAVGDPPPWLGHWKGIPDAHESPGGGGVAPRPAPGSGGGGRQGGGEATLSDFQWYERSDDAALQLALKRDPEATRRRLERVIGESDAAELIDDLSDDVTEGLFGTDVDPRLPEIVYLHGIMGSHLANSLGFGLRVWLEALSFARGNVAERLALQADGYTDAWPSQRLDADGHLKLKYGRARRKWRRRGFVVHPFDYDWRKPIASAADRLHGFVEQLAAGGPGRRFALVAHSMGGLVSALYAARHPEWRDRIERAVLVGSPLGGSYAPVEAVLGVYPFFRKLALASRSDDVGDLSQLAPTLPGLMEMLPNPDLFAGDPDYYAAATWPAGGPAQSWLEASRATKDQVLGSPLLAGASGIVTAHFGTVVSASIDEGELAAGPRTGPGDGTVPLKAAAVAELGELWEAEDYAHADMMQSDAVIEAVAALLRGARPGLAPLEHARLDFDVSIVPPEAAEPTEGSLAAIRARMEAGRPTAADIDWLFAPSLGDPPQ